MSCQDLDILYVCFKGIQPARFAFISFLKVNKYLYLGSSCPPPLQPPPFPAAALRVLQVRWHTKLSTCDKWLFIRYTENIYTIYGILYVCMRAEAALFVDLFGDARSWMADRFARKGVVASCVRVTVTVTATALVTVLWGGRHDSMLPYKGSY